MIPFVDSTDKRYTNRLCASILLTLKIGRALNFPIYIRLIDYPENHHSRDASREIICFTSGSSTFGESALRIDCCDPLSLPIILNIRNDKKQKWKSAPFWEFFSSQIEMLSKFSQTQLFLSFQKHFEILSEIEHQYNFVQINRICFFFIIQSIHSWMYWSNILPKNHSQ